MKTVFTKDNVVVSMATVHAEATVSCSIEGAVRHDVPDDVQVEIGWTFADGKFTKSTKPPIVSVIEYKMLFTSAERIATKLSTDPVIVDLQELMNDPRTKNVDLSLQSISDALDYMTSKGILAAGRKAEILTGVIK